MKTKIGIISLSLCLLTPFALRGHGGFGSGFGVGAVTGAVGGVVLDRALSSDHHHSRHQRIRELENLVDSLRQENIELREEKRDLKRKNRQLERENKDLKAQLKKQTTTMQEKK